MVIRHGSSHDATNNSAILPVDVNGRFRMSYVHSDRRDGEVAIKVEYNDARRTFAKAYHRRHVVAPEVRSTVHDEP